MSMTHGTNGIKSGEDPSSRPPSSKGSTGSSGSTKHVKCIGRYLITGVTLGKGNFARVEASVHTLTRAKVAIKIIETDKIKEDYVKKNLLREAQLMRRLRHPNIIRLYETMKTNNLYCLVTEVAEGGELLSHVRSNFKEKRLTEAATRPFIRQLVSALHHLHGFGIVHRDLKMENILLDKRKRNVKIVDFGLSNAAKPGSLLQTHCGSPEYAAPELFIPGREYGSEVDVWSLGVNMYAMLVGKLPFRSPRQGTKRRQKLLEQISAGLTEAHQSEMGHISSNGRNLIHSLLTPDPRHRVGLDEVMIHPWITKDGSQPLVPYKLPAPDPVLDAMIVDLMAMVLEVRPAEIRETVKRDRCDWLAAIYNLLHDQPEGRHILQRITMGDPEEQLVDAAHYHGSIEHFKLSQGDFLESGVGAKAPHGRHSKHHHTSVSQPDTSPADDYASSTLPVTKRERTRRSSVEPQPLGHPRTLGPVVHPPVHTLRRASIASPEHHVSSRPIPSIQNQYHHHHHHHLYNHTSSAKGGRRILPRTPNDYPYQQQQSPVNSGIMRPHSRAESVPDPLPAPWMPNLVPQNQLVHSPPMSGSPTTISPRARGFSTGDASKIPSASLKDPLVVSFSPESSQQRKKQQLKPLRPKSTGLPTSKSYLSKSIDGLNLRPPTSLHPGNHSVSGQPTPNRKISEGKIIPKGWISTPPQLGQPEDIRELMRKNSNPSSYKLDSSQQHNTGSAISVDQDMFSPKGVTGSPNVILNHLHSNNTSPATSKGSSPLGPSPQASKTQMKSMVSSGHEPQNFILSGEKRELSSSHKRRQQHQYGWATASQKTPLPSPFNPTPSRSISAMHGRRISDQKLAASEMFSSMGNMSVEQSDREKMEEVQTDDSKDSHFGVLGGLFGRAFKKNSLKREKSASMTIHRPSI